MKKPIFILVLFSLFFIGGCASIFNGTTQDVKINSNPQKADVVIKTGEGMDYAKGTTPMTQKLEKKNTYRISIKLGGYKETEVMLTQKVSGLFIGNILCGGIIGMIVDYSNGAMWNLEPGYVNVSLVTAMNKELGEQTYAVLKAVDKDGELRTVAVPLIKE